MPILSTKRQITLPKELCDRLMVAPGDDLDILEHDGHITIIKKRTGAGAGALKHLKANTRYSDADSLQDAISKKHATNKRKRHAA